MLLMYIMRKHSWFDGLHLKINDMVNFCKYYIDGNSLKMCSIQAGVSYGSTAVDWAYKTREIFIKNMLIRMLCICN